jgi:hypothetical protein
MTRWRAADTPLVDTASLRGETIADERDPDGDEEWRIVVCPAMSSASRSARTARIAFITRVTASPACGAQAAACRPN